MANFAEDKARIRREMIARREAAPAEWRTASSARIVEHALALPELASAREVAAYAAKGSEVGTSELIAAMIRQKGSVLLPRVDARLGLVFHRILDYPGGLSPGAFGILEPDPVIHGAAVPLSEIDLIFVPGAVFDRRGARIGYGKGHYDRMLSVPHRASKIGLAFGLQLADALPSEAHDVLMDAIVTEAGVIRCQGSEGEGSA